MEINALVITGFGINCEEEMAAAYRLAGAKASIVHLNEILLGEVSIHDYDLLNFPGGFSFGDDIASGIVLGNKIKFKQLATQKTFLEEIKTFIKAGKYILGICNGFQVLVKMGLLPNLTNDLEQEVTLTQNDSGKFMDRWCYLKVNPSHNSPFLKNIDTLAVPIRHGEGKLLIKNNFIKEQIIEQNLNCLSYCDDAGNINGEYPENPNGSTLNCAGLSDPTGQILGLMPHPEAFLSLYNHPNWGQIKRQNPDISEEGDGLKLFKNIVQHILEKKTQQVASL